VGVQVPPLAPHILMLRAVKFFDKRCCLHRI